MTKFIVKEIVTANFGTLSGWSVGEEYDTLEQAEQNCGKWGCIFVKVNGCEYSLKDWNALKEIEARKA